MSATGPAVDGCDPAACDGSPSRPRGSVPRDERRTIHYRQSATGGAETHSRPDRWRAASPQKPNSSVEPEKKFRVRCARIPKDEKMGIKKGGLPLTILINIGHSQIRERKLRNLTRKKSGPDRTVPRPNFRISSFLDSIDFALEKEDALKGKKKSRSVWGWGALLHFRRW